MRDRQADVGLAFDGDADLPLALDRQAPGTLSGAAVVTVMSCLGFKLASDQAGIRVVETRVGDRYVLEALEEEDPTLGGEQSGQVVLRDLATTGDGLLAGLRVLGTVARSGRTLAELAAMGHLPRSS